MTANRKALILMATSEELETVTRALRSESSRIQRAAKRAAGELTGDSDTTDKRSASVKIVKALAQAQDLDEVANRLETEWQDPSGIDAPEDPAGPGAPQPDELAAARAELEQDLGTTSAGAGRRALGRASKGEPEETTIEKTSTIEAEPEELEVGGPGEPGEPPPPVPDPDAEGGAIDVIELSEGAGEDEPGGEAPVDKAQP